MKLTSFTALTALASASTTLASTQLVKNFCLSNLWLTFNIGGARNEPFQLPSGQAFVTPIVGEGNEVIVSRNADIYSDQTPKFVLGTSTSAGILYWSIGNAAGDPFAQDNWNITSDGSAPNVCGNATTYEFNVRACQDSGVTLTVNLCSQ